MPKSKNKIKVLIVDDHLIFRVGLGESIETDPDMTIVGEATTGVQAIEMYRKLQPDVTMMDLRLPLMGGVDATKAIRKDFPNEVGS